MSNTLDFTNFRDGPGGEICARFGFDISGYADWREMRHGFGDQNEAGAMEKKLRQFDGYASSGERAVLLGFLFALGFYSLADELAEGRAFRSMSIACFNLDHNSQKVFRWREKVIASACRWPSGAAGAPSRPLPRHL